MMDVGERRARATMSAQFVEFDDGTWRMFVGPSSVEQACAVVVAARTTAAHWRLADETERYLRAVGHGPGDLSARLWLAMLDENTSRSVRTFGLGDPTGPGSQEPDLRAWAARGRRPQATVGGRPVPVLDVPLGATLRHPTEEQP